MIDKNVLKQGLGAAAEYLKTLGLTPEQIAELLRNLRPGGGRG